MDKLTAAQKTLMITLYDVAENEGGAIIIKNRYHPAAAALIRRGLVAKIDRGFYRPLYHITPAGIEYWKNTKGDHREK